MVAADWIAAVSLLVGATTYIIDKALDRKERTNAALQKLFDDYYTINDKQNGDYLSRRRFLGKVERLCIGMKSLYYSKRTVKKYGSKFLIMLYDKYEYIITETRNDFKDETKYSCFEGIVKKWKKA